MRVLVVAIFFENFLSVLFFFLIKNFPPVFCNTHVAARTK